MRRSRYIMKMKSAGGLSSCHYAGTLIMARLCVKTIR